MREIINARTSVAGGNLPVGASASNSLSVVSSRHSYAYLEEIFEICILYFLSIECYDWIVSTRSGAPSIQIKIT
jgi:hypothetical protein